MKISENSNGYVFSASTERRYWSGQDTRAAEKPAAQNPVSIEGMSRRAGTWMGVGTCAGAAALLIPVLGKTSLKNVVPFLFLIVIALVASRFGSLAGVVGTFLAGFLFATFLFRPVPSLNIEEVAARNNLIWMLLGGVILSDLFGAYKDTGKRPNS